MFELFFSTGVPFVVKAGVGTLLLMKIIVKSVVFAAVIIFLARLFKKSGRSEALSILEEKFAAGEINEDEFTRRKLMLKQK
jgi:uncharacterized membrane protein